MGLAPRGRALLRGRPRRLGPGSSGRGWPPSAITARTVSTLNRSRGLSPSPIGTAPRRPLLAYTQSRWTPIIRATSSASIRPTPTGRRSLAATRSAIASMSSSSRITRRRPKSVSPTDCARGRRSPVLRGRRHARRTKSMFRGLDAQSDLASATLQPLQPPQTHVYYPNSRYTTSAAAVRERSVLSPASLTELVTGSSPRRSRRSPPAYAAESGSQSPPERTGSGATRRACIARSRSSRRMRQ